MGGLWVVSGWWAVGVEGGVRGRRTRGRSRRGVEGGGCGVWGVGCVGA